MALNLLYGNSIYMKDENIFCSYFTEIIPRHTFCLRPCTQDTLNWKIIWFSTQISTWLEQAGIFLLSLHGFPSSFHPHLFKLQTDSRDMCLWCIFTKYQIIFKLNWLFVWTTSDDSDEIRTAFASAHITQVELFIINIT